MTRSRRVVARICALAVVVAGGAVAAFLHNPVATAAAAILPTGFAQQTVWKGLDLPTNIEFAPDGRVFVAEKSGLIKVFDNVADPTPTIFADLRPVVFGVYDRGLLGLAIHPEFPAQPYVYVLYSYDAPPGQVAPYWNDNCDSVGGPLGGKCIVTARLSRLQVAGDTVIGPEQVLIRDWCSQYPSHSIGDVKFGADGMLYVSAGDGASYDFVDYGQTQGNPCGDPTYEGGALRAQDVRSDFDPTGLHGSLLRLDPLTGDAAPGNPNIGSADPNTRRIVAMGFRNPFRFTMRPGTSEAWVADVGWANWEEINRVPAGGGLANYGWPCYEGAAKQPAYDGANMSVCETLYPTDKVTRPEFTYSHDGTVVPDDTCAVADGSSAAGVAFYPTTGGSFPAKYNGALFFSDHARGCIWAMLPAEPGGLPDPQNRVTFAAGLKTPVDLAVGPDGDLYFVDVVGEAVHRIRHFDGNQPPVADIRTSATSGAAPLAVTFSAAGSTDADPGDQAGLTYEWDFTGDGTVDSTDVAPSHDFPQGVHTTRLTVRDPLGATGEATVTVQSGNGAPTAVIDTPTEGTTWKVGDPITFTGHGTDPQDGSLPAAKLTWRVNLHHCVTPGNCHVHTVQDYAGTAGGSFPAPDHEYPSFLELVLTVTDSNGLSNTVSRRLDPRTVTLTFRSDPPGLQLAVGAQAQATPFTRTVIEGSVNSMSAVTPQLFAGGTYVYARWSDGGAQTHTVTATGPTTYTATFSRP